MAERQVAMNEISKLDDSFLRYFITPIAMFIFKTKFLKQYIPYHLRRTNQNIGKQNIHRLAALTYTNPVWGEWNLTKCNFHAETHVPWSHPKNMIFVFEKRLIALYFGSCFPIYYLQLQLARLMGTEYRDKWNHCRRCNSGSEGFETARIFSTTLFRPLLMNSLMAVFLRW